MKFLLSALLLLMAVLILYRRYFPVLGISTVNLNRLDVDDAIIVDFRDYNQSYKLPIKGAINIPVAYLNRNIQEIPRAELYIVASAPLEKNVGIRLLRKKGFRVVGYSIYDSNKIVLDGKSIDVKHCG